MPASNGIIHVTDKVLTPTSTLKNIPTTAGCTGSHDTLVAAVVQATLSTLKARDRSRCSLQPTAFADANIDLGWTPGRRVHSRKFSCPRRSGCPRSRPVGLRDRSNRQRFRWRYIGDEAKAEWSHHHPNRRIRNGVIGVINTVLAAQRPQRFACTASARGTTPPSWPPCASRTGGNLAGRRSVHGVRSTDQARTQTSISATTMTLEERTHLPTSSSTTWCSTGLLGRQLHGQRRLNGQLRPACRHQQQEQRRRGDRHRCDGQQRRYPRHRWPAGHQRHAKQHRDRRCTNVHTSLLAVRCKPSWPKRLAAGPFTVFAPTDDAFGSRYHDLAALLTPKASRPSGTSCSPRVPTELSMGR